MWQSSAQVDGAHISFSCCPLQPLPPLQKHPPQYIEAKEGGSITMTCTAFGNPKPIVTWLKEGTLLSASGKYQVSAALTW